MLVDLDYIESVKKALARINAENVDNLEFIKNGKHVYFDRDDIKRFKFMGLNNTDITDVISYSDK
jgi:hypothetical protein